MSLRELSTRLTQWRCERPDEWVMDEFIRLAHALEHKSERDAEELSEARRLLDEARKQEPVAWAYRFDLPKRHDDMHDNDEYSEVVYRTRRELSPDDPFGRRGRDFDDAADTTEIPLYAAPVPAQPAVPDDVARDAARYRWLRDRGNSLETRQYDKLIYNGPSCYHEVEGIRELKSESKLDSAIDAAMRNAQAAYDNACPPDDHEIPEEYIEKAEEWFDEDAPRHRVLAKARELMEADAKRTAEQTRARVLELLGASSSAEVAVMAYRAGLLGDGEG